MTASTSGGECLLDRAGERSSSLPTEAEALGRWSILPRIWFTPAVAKKDWQLYEEQIADLLTELGGPSTTVEFNAKRKGRLSGVQRQIDALVTGRFAANVADDVTAAVDCKRYARKVNIKHVESFIGFVDDLDVDLGLMITNTGYTNAAKSRTTRGIRLHVVKERTRSVFVVDTRNPPPVYHPNYDEAYYASEYFDGAPYGASGAMIEFRYIEESEYTRDPDVDPEWMSEPILSGTNDQVSWGDPAARARCTEAILSHHLGRPPTADEQEVFMNEIARYWEDGYPWNLYVGEIAELTGL